MGSLHPLVGRILEDRGIQDAEAFLNPNYDDRHDPFLMKDMDAAVSRILEAVQKGERICVWHDYDCDGIPGGALLSEFFGKAGYPVRTHVPERSDGYGLNETGLRTLADEGVSLVITVDCGITDNGEVAFAKTLGVDVIVTDHHLPQKELPPAIAVVNSHRADDEYPCKELCGTGVAFKLVEALIQKGPFDIPPGWEKWLLDLVALATVADMVPLVGENRTLVRWGLTVIHKGRRPGFRAIFEREKIPIRFVTEDDLAFSVAPKVNAASRMESPRLAFELLSTDSFERAQELAEKLETLNKKRRVEGMRVAKDVKKKIDGMPILSPIIVMGNRDWRPSLLGIAATSVVETYGKTVCLWGEDSGLIKGSCRSDGSVNIVTLMSAVKESFLDFGGHELSGGFSLAPEAVHALPERMERALVELFSSAPPSVGTVIPDTGPSSLTLAEANDSTFDALRTLAPFGRGNPKPLFRFTNVSVAKIDYFGKAREHVRLTLSDDSGYTADAIAFFVPRASFKDTLESLSVGDYCMLDASLERSHFRGKKELRLRIENITV
jgi:single-stranded-DNA-specific exonuclease